jgi:glyoxylase-like metal-dependent hydrolase (beta-lactamase superfamily II)
MQFKSFTFNPFLENTFVVWDETGECVVIDPGCYTRREQELLGAFLAENNLRPARLLNTHCHLDHVFGNAWVHRTYGLLPELTQQELVVLEAAPLFGEAYGIPFDHGPGPHTHLEPGVPVSFGNTTFQVLFTPGHSPGHVVFFHEESRNCFGGDVLFQGSVGRTDLPGGDMDTLMRSIMHTLLPLGDDVTVHPGHGPATTLGRERKHNMFLLEWGA